MASLYDATFYARQAPGSYRSAQIVSRLVMEVVPVGSVCDVGCGLGTWLEAFAELGVMDCIGVDGAHVDVERLRIPVDRFRAHDLTAPLHLSRTFDLVISLEVAEHLPAAAADTFVDSLARHGPMVLFSAAVPGQGGTGHINERRQSYWAAKFARRGYDAFDFVRPRIWRDSDVQWWYRQNCLLYVRRDCSAELAQRLGAPAGRLDRIHPLQIRAALNSPRRAFAMLADAVARRAGPARSP